MISKRNLTTLMLAVAISGGSGVFFGSHSRALAEDKKEMSEADFARDAQDHLKKAHEDVDHLTKGNADKSDVAEAKKAIDRADKALGRYIEAADKK
jgi:hypothetical protein